jgi:hypothetical protein
MKRMLWVVVSVAMVCLFAAAAYADLSDGLIAYYPFNGNTNDETGHGYDGTVNGEAVLTTDRFGNSDSAYYFDGIDDNITVDNDPALALDTYTLAAWFRADSDIDRGVIAIKGGFGSEAIGYNATYGFILQRETSCNHCVNSGFEEEGGVDHFLMADGPFDDETWHLATLTYDKAELKLYMDGVLVDSEVTDVAPEMNELPFRMGMNTHTTDRNFKGKIDDVRIYNRALSETEISELWHPGSEGVDLAPYFNFTVGRGLAYLDFDSDGEGGLVPDDYHFESVIPLGGNLEGEFAQDVPSWSPHELVIWRDEPDGHYRLGVYGFGSGDFRVYNPPVGPVDGTMDVGETRHFGPYWEFMNGIPEGPWSTDMTLIASGFPYPTPAGLFPDCSYIRLDHRLNQGLAGSTVWVLARGVGPVLEMEFDETGTYRDLNLLVYFMETDMSGDWDFYRTTTGDPTVIGPIYSTITQTGADLVLDFYCLFDPDFGTIYGSTVEFTIEGSVETVTLTGEYSGDSMDGVWTSTSGAGGTWWAERSAYAPVPNTLSIEGELCSEVLSVDSLEACAMGDYEDSVLEDIEINTSYDGGWIGLEFETPELLSSGTTFEIPTDGFEIELQGTPVELCLGYQDLGAQSGTVTIVHYDGTSLIGSYDITLNNDDQISGSFSAEIIATRP